MQQTMTPCDLQMRSHNLCEGSQCLCNPLHKLFAKTGCRICAGTSRLVRPDFIVQSKLVRWPGTCINSQPHCFFKLKQISNGYLKEEATNWSPVLTHANRQTDRETDRDGDGDRDRRQTDRHRQTQTTDNRHTQTYTYRRRQQTDTDRQRRTETDTDRQRETNRHTDRHIQTHTDTHTHADR